jgi:Heavy metal binding domain
MLRDGRIRRSSTAVVALRALIVALAAAAVVVAAVATRAADPEAGQRFVCPMHSEASSATPGDCPICGMALAPIGAARVAAPDPRGPEAVPLAALRSSDEAAQMLRLSIGQARRNTLPGEIYAPAYVTGDGAITAQLYRDELASLASDERASFVPAQAPDAVIAIRRDPAPPEARDAIAWTRFRVEPGAAAPPAGQIGWVKLAYQIRAMLVVRSTAVLRSADGPYVLVFSAGRGTLARRSVELGKEYAGMIAIVAGLRDKEFVVMANTAAFDAERRLQAAR